MSEPITKEEAMALYKPPFKYEGGYIWDADGNMVSDDDKQNPIQRVRGWGRIGAMQNACELQDKVGTLIAQALTEFWMRK